MRRSALVATGVSVVALTLVAAGGVVLASGAHERESSSPTSYCAAALRALRYTGDDTDHFRVLLDPVADLAPHEIRATVVALRRAAPVSPAYNEARQRWQNDATNECCECIGGHRAPDVEGVKPG
jgi:hypothetical protein